MLRRVLGVTVLAAASALTAVTAPAGSASMPPTACAKAYPVSQLRPGLAATGLTVSRGTVPERFSATILGVMHNGVGAGVDLVLARLDSAALRATGGAWGGMSGSPVYAPDGRLIGAVAYTMAGSASEVGLVPAEAMTSTLGGGAATTALPHAATAPVAGLRPLPLPVTVSGLTPARLQGLQQRVTGLAAPHLLVVAGDAAPATTVRSATALVPGGNVAISQAYGDVTAAAVGTVTAVCNGRALALGHGFSAVGATVEGANTAEVLYVQRDPVWGPYKVADVGPAVATVNQDRLVGVRAVLGIPPDGIQVVSTARNDGHVRHGATVVTSSAFVSSFGPYAVMANVDALLQRIGEGSALATWTVNGLRAGGRAWTLRLTNRFASSWDISSEAVNPLWQQLDTLYANPFEHVRFTSVHADVSVTDEMRQYSLASVALWTGDQYTPLTASTPITAAAGDVLALRVALRPYQGRGAARTVDLVLAVPETAAGEGSLEVVGGYPGGGVGPAVDTSAASSFDDVLAALRAVPRNDRLTARLNLGTGTGSAVEQGVSLDQVVAGSVSVPLTVLPPPEPTPSPSAP